MRDSLEHGIGLAVGAVGSVDMKWYEMVMDTETDHRLFFSGRLDGTNVDKVAVLVMQGLYCKM